jgi:peptidyl-dipeptidase Dcp
MMLFALMAIPSPVIAEEANPLLKPWTGPNGGVPPFAVVKPELFGPALETSMRIYRGDIERIAHSKEAPTFANTIEALEKAGDEFNRVANLFDTFANTMSGPEIQALETEWSPKFAALRDEIIQNAPLFQRIETLYSSPDKKALTAEQQRLLWLTYNDFARSGAQLSVEDKKKLSDINGRLASLYTQFGQNLLTDEEKGRVVIDDRSDLAGLPQSMVDAAAEDAKELGLDGQWVIRNTRSSAEPFLVYAESRQRRKDVWEMFVSRGDLGGDTDNNAVASEILKLRYQRARLLGFETHAHWQLAETMAKTPANAMELMEKVWKPAVARVAEEVADMEALAKELGQDITIEPWDYRFYAEKVRKKKYDLDAAELKPYLQLEKLLEAQFWVAEEMYGLTFTEVQGLPVYHPDVRVFEVTDRAKAHVGYWYFDPYAREGKRSGAWMSEYRTQEAFDKVVSPIVSNNSNYLKGKPGEPVLISWDDAETMFHEFGHALHGLLSQVNYPTLAGTNVARDFVEFPSQINEHWLSTPQVLKRFALHYQTGEPMPDELIAKMDKAATFNQGFSTVEYLSSALVDMKLHLAGGADVDVDAFEKDTLEALGMPRSIVMRHRVPQFAHVFSGDGYSAGYYSYLWSEVLDQDAWKAFEENGDPFNAEVAERFRLHILSAGNKLDPADAYRQFRGADPSIDPLLEARGFPSQGGPRPTD